MFLRKNMIHGEKNCTNLIFWWRSRTNTTLYVIILDTRRIWKCDITTMIESFAISKETGYFRMESNHFNGVNACDSNDSCDGDVYVWEWEWILVRQNENNHLTNWIDFQLFRCGKHTLKVSKDIFYLCRTRFSVSLVCGLLSVDFNIIMFHVRSIHIFNMDVNIAKNICSRRV